MVTQPRRVLVTGGTGVIGAWAVRELVERGDTVGIISRGQTTVAQSILAPVTSDVEAFEADVADALQFTSVIAGFRPDVIAHLASCKPWQIDVGFVSNPRPTIGVRSIIDATTTVLETARTLGVERVVFAGSKASYAPFAGEHGAPTYTPVPETYPSLPYDIYGIGKLTAEQIGAYYKAHLGVDFVSLRFGSTYGPFKRGAATMPAGLIAAAIERRKVVGEYNERTYRHRIDDFIYNRDVGAAVAHCVHVPEIPGAMYNIGTGSGSTVHDIIEALRDTEGVVVPDIEIVPEQPSDRAVPPHADAFAGILDSTRARDELGFETRYDLRAGIADSARFVSGVLETSG